MSFQVGLILGHTPALQFPRDSTRSDPELTVTNLVTTIWWACFLQMSAITRLLVFLSVTYLPFVYSKLALEFRDDPLPGW